MAEHFNQSRVILKVFENRTVEDAPPLKRIPASAVVLAREMHARKNDYYEVRVVYWPWDEGTGTWVYK